MTRRMVLLFALLLPAVALWAAGSENNFRFVILGDRAGGPRQEVYAQTWAEIDQYRPDFVINVGDTIQGTRDQTAEVEWDEINGFLAKYKQYPFYRIAGNHDIWSDFSFGLFAKKTGHPSTYSFDYQGAHFTVLDNSRDDMLGPSQLKFLEEDLQKNQSRKPKFVFFHKPFWLVLLKAGNTGFPLHEMAKKYGVDYVVSGHGHQFVRLIREGVTYMEVGSSGANIGEPWRLDTGFNRGTFYHFVQGQVKGGDVQFTVKELNDPFGRARTFDASHWNENGGVQAPAAGSRR
jgi:predicted phosphodiesterase